MRHFYCHPRLSTCSTILRAIKIDCPNITYTSLISGKLYDFKIIDTKNELFVKPFIAIGELHKGQMYDLDFDYLFIEAVKYGAKPTYKKFTGYSSGIAVIGEHIVSILRSEE